MSSSENLCEPVDFDEREAKLGQAKTSLTFDQHKRLRDLSAFIDKDQE